MTWTEGLSLVIAAMSLLLSGYVLWRQRRDQGRAHFTAGWDDRSSVTYVNHGPGAARDVKVSFDARFVDGLSEVSYIAPFQDLRLHMTRALAERPPQTLDLTWKDNRRAIQRLSIPLAPYPADERRAQRPKAGEIEEAIRKVARDETVGEPERVAKRASRNRRR